jgi:hypothetical protein
MTFDLPGLVSWLDTHGVPLCYPPTELGTQSRVTAIRDPDGNQIELTELGPSWLDHLEEHRAAGGDLVEVWRAHLTG